MTPNEEHKPCCQQARAEGYQKGFEAGVAAELDIKSEHDAEVRVDAVMEHLKSPEAAKLREKYRNAGRAEALEEAAKVAESVGVDGRPSYELGVCSKVAAAIRALKGKP